MLGDDQPLKLTAQRKSSTWWVVAILFLVGGSMLTETTPLLLGTGAEARVDWGFPYVTMKFVLLPGVSFFVLGAIFSKALRRSHVPWQGWLAGLAAIAYIVSIALWPVPWLL